MIFKPAIFLVLISAFTSIARAGASPALVSPFLWNFGWTDWDFHKCLHDLLTEVVCNKPVCKAVVVGVEKGNDVIQLASANYFVVGIEPFPMYVKMVDDKVKAAGLSGNVELIQAGAGKGKGTIQIDYNDESVRVPIVQLDDTVSGPIEILSVDVHGEANNYDVLAGARALLERGDVISIWVEVKPYDWAEPVLKILDEFDYVMFDVQYVGGSKQCKEEGLMPHLCRYKHKSDDRPERINIEEYIDHIREVRSKHFSWMQTDFVAIRRDYVDTFKEKIKAGASRCPPTGTPANFNDV